MSRVAISLGFAVAVAAIAVLGRDMLPGRDRAARLERHMAELEQEHEAEIATLSAENQALAERNRELGAEIADVEFLVAHATLELRDARGAPPDYDMERFLRHNPEARKYFPYLTDAVKRYEEIWPVDPMFALAILKQESDFGRFVVSKAGALGDAQFIESTARHYGLDVREPWTWKNGRRSYNLAAQARKAARQARDEFLRGMERGLEPEASERSNREQLTRSFGRFAGELARYYDLMEQASRLTAEADEAFREYEAEIDRGIEYAREVERRERARVQREDALIRVSGVRPERTQAERDVDVQLAVNDALAQIDPRLSPMLFTDALVHHLAELFYEFKGDERLVAARYNASRRAMEAAVAGVGGGVGIPLLDETQDYVNRVFVLRAYFAVDGGVVPETLDLSCCARFARR